LLLFAKVGLADPNTPMAAYARILRREIIGYPRWKDMEPS
jgi:hypothetical protein